MLSEDLEFFSTDFDNWNYNEFSKKTGVDPSNNKKRWIRSVIT